MYVCMYVCIYVCVHRSIFYVCMYVCMHVYTDQSVCMYVYTSQPKCGVIVLYTDDVRRFFSTLKSNGPIKYIPLYVCIYFSLTKTLKFMYVCIHANKT